ncbi:MAG: archaetidylserine decarboxylase, partial [Myxococcota bacterium]
RHWARGCAWCSSAMPWASAAFASIAWPGPIPRAEIRLFARLAGVDLAEARDDVGDFATLQQFFTRALVPGARPIEAGDDVLVSPCDGAWGAAGQIEDGTLLQVKGRRYRVSELLGHEAWAADYDGGDFATLYLSPRDYHRFHTPAAGRITRLDYLPGALWPVNSLGLQGVDGLFARNERICAELALAGSAGGPGILMIAVGATMVGSVRLTFDELCTNVPGGLPTTRRLGDKAPSFSRGEEWGHFEFGSTIVLLTPPGGPRIEPKPVGTALRLGESIGRLR